MPINRPTTGELVESVREMMEENLLPSLEDKNLIYQSRVAINVLKIVERELQQLQDLLDSEQQGLQDLLGEKGGIESLNVRLVDKINAGDYDGDNRQLITHFEQVVLKKIAIDNPSYSTYKDYLVTGKLNRY